MAEAKIERRSCERFRIPGATACYRKSSLLSNKKGFDEEFCPVIDLSLGGLRFLCQKPLKIRHKVSVEITIPGDRSPLILIGIVRWIGFNPGKSYKFQAGLQLNPYGDKKNHNSSEALTRLTAIEENFRAKKAANSSEPKP